MVQTVEAKGILGSRQVIMAGPHPTLPPPTALGLGPPSVPQMAQDLDIINIYGSTPEIWKAGWA